jgi:FkbM family methyltransferase
VRKSRTLRRDAALRPALLMAVLGSIFVLGSACGTEGEDATEPRADDVDPFSDQKPGPELGQIYTAIEQQRARLREVGGREGILLEESRYSLFDEELIIRDFFQDQRDGIFLDVGCAWPVRSSNTFYLEKHLGWKGIGVDAVAEYGPGWRSKRPNSRFFSYLVTDRSGQMETFFKSPNPGLSSTNRTLATGKAFGDDLEPEAVQIETITLDDLLDREGIEKLDLLSMDIEGHEPLALAGFDIERFQPELVVIEGKLVEENDGKVARYFERHGYERIERYRAFDAVNSYFERRSREGAE